MKASIAALAALGVLAASPAHADEADLKAEIASLKQQLAAQGALLQRLEAKIDAEEAERPAKAVTAAAAPAGPTAPSVMPAPAATPSPAPVAEAQATTFGGYGEAAFNGYLHDGSRNQADLHRFVLFLGHRFSDRLSFNSEVEWEHAVASAEDRGETEIEQAYLDYQLTDSVKVKAGLFLMPFGFLNQAHEPPVYYGVERNEVETRIIPSTWREGGVGLTGTARFGLTWDVGLTTGFDVAKLDDASAPLAASHQELQFAHAQSLSYYGALNYRGVPGLVVGGGVFSGGGLHANADHKADGAEPDFGGIEGRVTLWDAHARWQSGNWDLQALYARGSIGQADRIDGVLKSFNEATGAERPYVPGAFYGWLVQGAYTAWRRNDLTLTPFVRYEQFDTQASLPTGLLADPANRGRVLTTGISLRPLQEVVFKADYQRYFDQSANDRFNFGIGYMF